MADDKTKGADSAKTEETAAEAKKRKDRERKAAAREAAKAKASAKKAEAAEKAAAKKEATAKKTAKRDAVKDAEAALGRKLTDEEAAVEKARKKAQSQQTGAKDAQDDDGDIAINTGNSLKHTGRWIPKTPIQYLSTEGLTVRRAPKVKLAELNNREVDNVLDDIPAGVAKNLFKRGLIRPELR